jgi:chromate transporter
MGKTGNSHWHRHNNDRKCRLTDLALFFLRLGTTAFGGPAVHIAMMEEEVVSRRGWLSREEFLDLLGAANLIPGPSSTEMAIFIGQVCRGWAGLLLSGVCFILPAMLMVLGFAWAYVRFGNLPQVGWLLYGIKPVVIAIVVQALWQLGRTAIKDTFLGLLAVLGIILNLMGINILLVLFGGGLVSGMWHGLYRERGKSWPALVTLLASVGCFGAAAYVISGLKSSGEASLSLQSLFLFFVKVGAIVFGSGYVLVAFLQADLVGHWHWLTNAQLLDAIAVGQITPGPVFTTATFIGYLLAGLPGALIATAGIFLPGFLFVAAVNPLIVRIRRSGVAGAFLDGVIVASLALMAVVSWHLGREAIVDLPTALLTMSSVYLLIHRRLNSLWLLAAGAILGVCWHMA